MKQNAMHPLLLLLSNWTPCCAPSDQLSDRICILVVIFNEYGMLSLMLWIKGMCSSISTHAHMWYSLNCAKLSLLTNPNSHSWKFTKHGFLKRCCNIPSAELSKISILIVNRYIFFSIFTISLINTGYCISALGSLVWMKRVSVQEEQLFWTSPTVIFYLQ